MDRLPTLLLLAASSCLLHSAAFAVDAPAAPPKPAADTAKLPPGTATDPFGVPADDPASALYVPKMIQVQVEFIELPHPILTDLLLDTPVSADATEVRKKVTALTTAGKASILDTQLITGRSGEKQLAESIEEYIYPTEYEPGEVPQKVGLPEKTDGVTPEDLKSLRALVTPPTPTSFETRNLGSTLETEPALSAKGDLVELTLSPSLTWHTGDEVFLEQKDVLGNLAKVQMPRIYTLRVNTSLTLRPGQPALAAVLSPKDDKGVTDLSRKVMVFVKATILEVR